MKTVKRVFLGCFIALVGVSGSLFAIIFIAMTLLRPIPGEWATTVRIGPVTVPLGMPSLIRLATAPWVASLLNGRQAPTRIGTIHLRWQADTRTLTLRCAPCTVAAPGLGGDTLRLDEAELSVRRQGSKLDGEAAVGRVLGVWRGTLTNAGLTAQLDVPSTPISQGYALFAGIIPELAHAEIDGLFGLSATLALPSGSITLAPRVEGFAVRGLGKAALAGARSTCAAGLRKSRLAIDSPLARAVIAAEDQRFFEHTGLDLLELAASFERNQRSGDIERGASTLSQQLARLLITGDERTPARKLRELLYAVEMEQTLGKARILRLYLAHAPWGDKLCGADAAAQHYFGIRAQELDAAQAVWLAAMLHNPALEARRWAETGHINLARAQWVAHGLRPLPRRQREALAQQLADAAWPAPERVPPGAP